MNDTNVCIIGAGIAGLASLKELTELGIQAEAYEMMPVVGGVFGSYCWKGGFTTSSSIFTWFSQLPAKNRQTFYTWEEFFKYLNSFADHFNIRDKINHNCKVISAVYKDNQWVVQFHRKNWSNGHFFHPQQNDIKEEIFTRTFTHLIICTGLHNKPRIPKIEGLDKFKGKILHSSEYRDAENFRDQKVLVVGAGESGSDITFQVSGVAAECTISLRSAPGTLYPRFVQGNTADIRDDRLTYNLPRMMSWLLRRGHRRYYRIQKENSASFQWAANSNYDNDRTAFNTNACKSFGIPDAIFHHGLKLKGEVSRIEDNVVYFDDGTHEEVDSILFSTGFKQELPFLEPDVAQLIVPVNKLWKNMASTKFLDKLFVIGYTRPNQINLLTVCEMQARLMALIVAGKRQLPLIDIMEKTIKHDQQWMYRYYKDRYEKNLGLVDFLFLNDSLAAMIGCKVPFLKAFFRDPHLWLKLVFASMSGSHYRLVGPGSNWEESAAIIKATPTFRNKRNAVLRWSILSFFTVVSAVFGLFSRTFKSTTKQAYKSLK